MTREEPLRSPQTEAPVHASLPPSYISVVSSTAMYNGSTWEDQVDRMIKDEAVLVFGRKHCPYYRDVIELLVDNLNVTTHVVLLNEISNGDGIQRYILHRTGHSQTPLVFIKSKFIGGCADIMALYQIGELEIDTLRGLIHRSRVKGGGELETARLTQVYRSKAFLPPLMYPHTVNKHVNRIVWLIIFALAIVNAAFYDENWARFVAVALLSDFLLRVVAGEAIAPSGALAMLIASFYPPNFQPGAPEQIDIGIGVLLTSLSTMFFYLEFEGSNAVAAAFLAILALIAAFEGFFSISIGSMCVERGIQLEIIPDHIYRVYNRTRLETMEAYNYKYTSSSAPRPRKINTDRSSPVALRYKTKSEEWSKDEFDPIRYMSITYFMCPLSIATLGAAFKISANYNSISQIEDLRQNHLVDGWFKFISSIAAFIFVFMLFMYMTKVLLFPNKVRKEKQDPHYGPYFSTITISFMIFGILCYDLIPSQGDNSPAEVLGRVFFWCGSVVHVLLTIGAMSDWIGRRLSFEHLSPHWLLYPIGLGMGAFTAPVVGPFSNENPNNVLNLAIARFFFSYSRVMGFTLYILTFLKVATSHNSDVRLRHGIWFWMAQAGAMALGRFSLCLGDEGSPLVCADSFDFHYFTGIFLFLAFIWVSLPTYCFFGRDDFSMQYWTECFALGMLAMASSLYYLTNGWEISAILEYIFLIAASTTNGVALLHTLRCLLLKRGVSTPEIKWDPLSFILLTHDAVCANLPILQYYLHAIDLDDASSGGNDDIAMFAAHFNRFRVVHEEHLKHEDRVVYKAFNDYFPRHGRKFTEDHRDDITVLLECCELADTVLDSIINMNERKLALENLRRELPAFFNHLTRHFVGEEDHLHPIGRKYLPIDLKVTLTRECWQLTPAERWEIILPFVLINLPRHEQRVRYLKALCWAMPERCQQFGAIVYRNVDAVMWVRIRRDLAEIIPRGAASWRRYY